MSCDVVPILVLYFLALSFHIVSISDASGPTTPLSTRGTCRASFGFGGVHMLAAHVSPRRSFSILSLCLVGTLIL